jgi:hypothetical protein
MRVRTAVLTVVAVVAGSLGLSAAPAMASTGDGLVSGTGTWTDDWWDEGPISTSANAHSNAAAMWQGILWADGHLAYSGIDCRFGSGTASATRVWQRDHGLPDDGIVGPKTLKKASAWLYAGSGGQIIYQGVSGRYLTFHRGGADGTWWEMYVGSDPGWLWYDTANFPACG